MIKIQIPLKGNSYFLKVLELLSPFYPFNQLGKREREVLSFLIYYSYERRDIEYSDRMKIIFNYNTRQTLYETMKISIYNLNNLLKSLRDKGFIGIDSINKKYLFTPETHGEFLFTFKYSE